MDSPGAIRDHCFAVGSRRQPGVQNPLCVAGYRRRSPAVLVSSRLLTAGSQVGSGPTVHARFFAPWLARHLRPQKRQWHCPPRASAGGWIIGSSDNGPPAGRFHYSSGEAGRHAGSRELDWSIRPIRYIHDVRESIPAWPSWCVRNPRPCGVVSYSWLGGCTLRFPPSMLPVETPRACFDHPVKP
jgi:hypothetical protein